MQKKLLRLSVAAFTVAVTISCAAAVEKLTGFKSESADLPLGERTFPGPNADAINNNCITCHSAGMVLYQPVMSRASWQAEVDKMRMIYKAPIPEEDVKPIVDYLAQLKGPH
jgi:cytochrome c5